MSENTTFYALSHNVPDELRSCANCILNEPGNTICTPQYKKAHKTDKPCPKWDGGAIAEF